MGSEIHSASLKVSRNSGKSHYRTSSAKKQLFVGIQNREFRANRISQLRPERKWGFWATSASWWTLSTLARHHRTGLLARVVGTRPTHCFRVARDSGRTHCPAESHRVECSGERCHSWLGTRLSPTKSSRQRHAARPRGSHQSRRRQREGRCRADINHHRKETAT